ncbi:hypothetical protein CC78DRAFT_578951 [Lojkania enalia]|uniref:Uncharacterized protein n=1 Tax=Lojkania enalia TaxID=147567 RepID=A0A9P4KG23_9PLEO|nr:hypothetical protein CC78DRAFT_578951 [Didymosphaeria enalia]
MPPTLRGYNSDEGFGTVPVIEGNSIKALTVLRHPSRRSGPESTENGLSATPKRPFRAKYDGRVEGKGRTIHRFTLKERKKSSILEGLNLKNVIVPLGDEVDSSAPKETLPTSSLTRSSYRTRAYHPMDEVISPLRAAKRKSRYEEEVNISDGLASSFDNDNHTESDTEVEENADAGTRGEKNKSPAPSRAVRRTSRQANREAMYNTNIHPQDTELEELVDFSDIELPEPKRRKISLEESSDMQGEVYDENGYMIELSDTEDCGSEISAMPDVQHGESPMIRMKDEDAVSEIPIPGQPFVIYEETLEAQLAAEASASSPTKFNDDDKENDDMFPDGVMSLDPRDGVTIRLASTLSGYRHEGNSFHQGFDDYAAEGYFYSVMGSRVSPRGSVTGDGTDEFDEFPSHDTDANRRV